MFAITASLRRSAAAFTTALALAFSLAAASDTVQIDASGLDFGGHVGAAGIDLAWDGGLVLTLTTADTTSIGNLALPGYAASALPTDALGRIMAAEALSRLDVITSHPGGVSFVQQGISVNAVLRAYADRLIDLGFEVADAVGEPTLSAHFDGQGFRAVFGAAEGGVVVYLGR